MVSVAPHTSPRQLSPPKGNMETGTWFSRTHLHRSTSKRLLFFSQVPIPQQTSGVFAQAEPPQQPRPGECRRPSSCPRQRSLARCPSRSTRNPHSSWKPSGDTKLMWEEEATVKKKLVFFWAGSNGTFSEIRILIQERIPFKAWLSLELQYQSKLTISADQKARKKLQVKCPEN